MEKLGSTRRVKDEWQYRVKWLTFPSKPNSWVKYEDLNPLCQQLVRKIHYCLPTYGQKKCTRAKDKGLTHSTFKNYMCFVDYTLIERASWQGMNF